SDANVLLIGETGSGKEVAAHYIHECSSRKNAQFTAINCGAIPENLMDSELFGHEAGAFTGAAKARKGKIELTLGGTLFLDEVNSMSMSMQVKLLRVLEERVIERLGSNKLIPVDVRLVAATQVDLRELVNTGAFREDLFYRLNVIPVTLPPLKERREDIPLLFNHFLVEACARYNKDLMKVGEDMVKALMFREWPGNVRELRNAAERFVLTGEIPDLNEGDGVLDEVSDFGGFSVPKEWALPEKVGFYEKHLIENELSKYNGVVDSTYKSLGVPRKTLYDKMKKYQIDRKEFKL
ncbi:MAG: sigma-54-dependent Fis family transcriptional regulator, partial [Lentisphaeraceae bacterium]|nr:sigma-54-dependent Fis family transcriptional regulator [Lentisphaeraceae bacterium]